MEAKGQATPGRNGPDAPVEAVVGTNTSSIRADFEGLLALAESLQRSFERHSDVYRRSRFTLLGFVLIAYAGVAGGLSLIMSGIEARVAAPHGHILPFNASVVLVVADASLVLLAGCYASSSWRYSEQVKRAKVKDKSDLTEVVELLREIEPVVAREEGLSALERVQIRIRLSRFGVGSSSRSGTATASTEIEDDFCARKSRVDQGLAKPF